MVTAIVNSNFPKSATDTLNRNGFITIPLPSNDKIEFPVSTHPDMLVFIGFDAVVCHRDYYNENRSTVDLILGEKKLILSDEIISKEYPLNAIFNAAIVGKNLLCNTKYISKHILGLAKENNANVIHVNQGYTKCSTLIVGENDIITSDRGIHAAAQASGINSLLICTGKVSLEPYEYGFIGGASGTYGNKVYFCGSLDAHPDKENICEFIAACGKECIFLPFDKLTDTGSILFVE